jgi:predicted nucleotidyltransferase
MAPKKAKSTGFSTHILDEALRKKKILSEKRRKKYLAATFKALDEFSERIHFKKAYIFGSILKRYRFGKNSDIDIGFIGLKSADAINATAYLSAEVGANIDVVQLEGCRRLRDKIIKEGVEWKKKK